MFQKNVLLKNHTSFKIGGPAKYFFEARNLKDLIKALKEAKKTKIPIFILGGGTNLLVNDKGYEGLVLKIKTAKYKITNKTITTEAGVSLAEIVGASLKAGLTGLDWAVGIPGTLGGAVYGNCGAFGSSISKTIKNIVALNTENLKIKKYSNKQCQFSYRRSVFEENKDIILSMELRLEKNKSKINLETIKEYLKRRKERISIYPSAGSIFKNMRFENLNKKTQKLIPEEKIKGGMLSAGYLVESCGLKGKRIGGAKISEKQANIIVNFKKAEAKDVSALIDLAKKQVKKKFGIALKEEIIMI